MQSNEWWEERGHDKLSMVHTDARQEWNYLKYHISASTEQMLMKRPPFGSSQKRSVMRFTAANPKEFEIIA